MLSITQRRYACYALLTCIFILLLLSIRHRQSLTLSSSWDLSPYRLSQPTQLATAASSAHSGSSATPAGIDKLLSNYTQLRVLPDVRCKVYSEFRGLNFQDPRLSSILCQDAVAYRLQSNGAYPLCELAHPFNELVLSIVLNHSKLSTLPGVGAKKSKYSIYVYPFEDYISLHVLRDHVWETHLVSRIVGIATLLPNTTFVDVGSNLGVYTLAAAQLQLPTLSLEANIRNALRLRLSLAANGFDLARSRIVWNFVSPDVRKLQFLHLTGDCNVGASSSTTKGRPLLDTVPIMPLRSEKLAPLIPTRNVVMKIDVEGGEADFVRTSGSLFDDFNIIAVQMEFIQYFAAGNRGRAIVDFFTRRSYVPFNAHNLGKMDAGKPQSFDTEVIWIRGDFVQRITGKQ